MPNRGIFCVLVNEGMGSPWKSRKADDSYRVMSGGGSMIVPRDSPFLPEVVRAERLAGCGIAVAQCADWNWKRER